MLDLYIQGSLLRAGDFARRGNESESECMFEILRFAKTGKPGEGKHFRTAEVELHTAQGIRQTRIEIGHKAGFDYYRRERKPVDPYGVVEIGYMNERYRTLPDGAIVDRYARRKDA